MTTYTLPDSFDFNDAQRVVALCEQQGRRPEGWRYAGGNTVPTLPVTLVWDSDLTPAELVALERIVKTAGAAVNWRPADYAKFENEAAALKAYLALNNPTNAQTAAALKALIRVVAAIVRQTL